MTNERTKYVEELMKFVIGEEVKLKRTKGEKVTIKELGVGHLADEAKGLSVKEGKREYASGTISKMKKDSARTGEQLVLKENTRQDANDYYDSKVSDNTFHQWSLDFEKLMEKGNDLFQKIWDEQPFAGKGETEAEKTLGKLMDDLKREYGFRSYY